MYKIRNKKKVEKPIIDEVVEQKVNIDETTAQSLADEFDENSEKNEVTKDSLSGLENDDQPQYPLPEKEIEERPNIIINKKSQILIGDNKDIQSITDKSNINDEFDNDSDDNLIDDEPVPIDVKSLSKKDYRYYLRTGRIPQ